MKIKLVQALESLSKQEWTVQVEEQMKIVCKAFEQLAVSHAFQWILF